MDLMTRRRALMAQQLYGGIAIASGNPLTFIANVARSLKSMVIPFEQTDGITQINISQTDANLFNVSNIRATENLQFTDGTALYTTVSTRNFVRWNCNLHRGYNGSYTGISYQFDTYNPTVLTWTMTIPDNVGSDLYLHIGHSSGQGGRDGMFWYPITPGTYYFTVNILSASPNVVNGFSFDKIVISDSAFTVLPISWQSEVGIVYDGTLTLNDDSSADLVINGNNYHFANVGHITTLVGENTIWTDTNGTNTAEYWIKNT